MTFEAALNGPPPQGEVYSDTLPSLRVDNVFYTTHNVTGDDESDSDH